MGGPREVHGTSTGGSRDVVGLLGHCRESIPICFKCLLLELKMIWKKSMLIVIILFSLELKTIIKMCKETPYRSKLLNGKCL